MKIRKTMFSLMVTRKITHTDVLRQNMQKLIQIIFCRFGTGSN